VKTALKYSPKNLGEVVYPSEAVRKRIQAYMSGQLEGNLLLWGPNGTGKTTVAELLPQYISGPDALVESEDFDEILSKKDLSGFIANACSIVGFSGQAKYFMVFHEFDNAKVNCNKLWTAMDKYSDRLMVIITTNNPMNVPKSVRSRCDEIAFPALTARQVLPRAQKILAAEGVSLPDNQVLHYLMQIEHLGDLRKYLAKLDDIIYLVGSGDTLPAVPNLALPAHKIKFTVV
jgi:replication-associated recombination protein RarA